MSMRKLTTTCLIALAATVFGAGLAMAQQDQQERLRRLLEDKFGPAQSQSQGATRGLPGPAQQKQQRLDENDVYVIRPDGSVERPTDAPQPAQPAQPGRRSLLDEKAPARAGVRVAAASDRSGERGAVRSDILTFELAQEETTTDAPADRPRDKRERHKFMVKRNTFVVQLKPDATSEQIDDLIAKYNLTVKRYVPSLGVLYVERQRHPEGTPPNAKREGGANRSLSAPRTASPPETLSSVLEPRIITDIRKHPAVDAAFVDSTVGPRTLPKASNSKVQTPDGTSRWTWDVDATDDGNWGLKVMRMPAVWSILDGYRKANPDRPRTRISFLDNGFGSNRQVIYSEVWGGMPPSPILADCGRSHGTHVAGIVGATFGYGLGVDGAVPNARLEAIPITRELLTDSFTDGVTDQAQQNVSFFMDAIADLSEFLDQSPVTPGERRVVNVSLAYNWAGVSLAAKADTASANPTANKVIRDQVRQHAKVVQTVVNRLQDRVLFVSAAGNDSDEKTPVSAEYATPFAYAGTHIQTGFKSSPNILVVEARGRNNERASFSNVGGHVAAPGVDVMSTFASDKTPFGVCSGTSQAAPHVTALAAILFELDPNKTPTEIATIIRQSAVTGSKGSAPMVDGLAAVLALSPDSARYLADLNGDGKVDAADLKVFKDSMVALEEAKFGGQSIDVDLNGDGVVDQYERCYPRIDLNGSGRASYDPSDARLLQGKARSDLDMIELGWTDTAKPFAEALKESGLLELFAVWSSTGIVASVDAGGPKAPCQ